MVHHATATADATPQPPRILHTSGAVGTALPTTFTSFVGRERELREIVTLLGEAETRLVTLVGPGGVGKTRLSIEVAKTLASDTGGRIAFVDLSTIPSNDVLEAPVARSLGIRE